MGYNYFISTALDADTDIPRMVMGVTEILTFFPKHTQWFPIIGRFVRHEWAWQEMARVALNARGHLNQKNADRRSAALRHQISTGGKIYYNDPSWTKSSHWDATGHPDSRPFTPPANGRYVDLYEIPPHWGLSPDKNGTPRQLCATKPTLSQVIHGVVNWPTGEDAGVLTQALRWAQAQGADYCTTHDIDDIPNIIAAQGFTHPRDATTTAVWDIRARYRTYDYIPLPIP